MEILRSARRNCGIQIMSEKKPPWAPMVSSQPLRVDLRFCGEKIPNIEGFGAAVSRCAASAT